MKNFIVPIDFSTESLCGLNLAVLFSKKQYINVQMVHVLNPSSDSQSAQKDDVKKAEERFEKLIEEYAPLLENDSKIRYIIKKGKVYREVVNQVNSYKDAVVSASTHGASGFEELFAGSNALKIIASAHSPVLTIRKGPVPKVIKKIVLPIKIHRDTRQKVPMAAEVAKLFGAEVHVLTISTRNNKKDIERLHSYANQSVGFLKSRKVKTVMNTVIGESLPTLTLNYAEAVNADMIIMMSSAIDKWNVLFGSYAQQMLARSRFPLLSVKPKPKQLPSGFSTLG